MELYLIRHGETDFNLQGIVQGGGVDSDLNDKGRKQARAFFEHYKEMEFDAVYASTLKRTHQTLAPWVEEKKYNFVQDSALVELGWGILEGKVPTPEEKKLFDWLREEWAKGNVHQGIEGGESPQQCWNRLDPFLSSLQERHQGQKVLICSHGRTSRVLLSQVLGYGLSKMEEFPHSNTGLNILHFSPNGKIEAEVLNDTTHLQVLSSNGKIHS
ncbi:histidine phosphatase family protein [bacterium]|nr:histidine phosphatase family protein [bacterium]